MKLAQSYESKLWKVSPAGDDYVSVILVCFGSRDELLSRDNLLSIVYRSLGLAGHLGYSHLRTGNIGRTKHACPTESFGRF